MTAGYRKKTHRQMSFSFLVEGGSFSCHCEHRKQPYEKTSLVDY